MAGSPCGDIMRIVLLGKTGAGKSTCGNRILGDKTAFEASLSFVSMTTECIRSEAATVSGSTLAVIDTPGIFDTNMDEDALQKEVGCCIELSVPGPHAFILVIRLDTRFTEEEMGAVDWIEANFGKGALDYTIILFTHADRIREQPVEDYIAASREIQHVIDRCGGRYHTFNNHDGDNDEVTILLREVEKMVAQNGGGHYTSEVYKKAQRRLKMQKVARGALGGMTGVGVGAAVAGGVAIAAAHSVVVAPIVVVGGAVVAAASGVTYLKNYKGKKQAGKPEHGSK